MKRSSYIKMLFIFLMLVGILVVATCVYAAPVVTTTVTADVSSFIGYEYDFGFHGNVSACEVDVNNVAITGSNSNVTNYNWSPTTNPATSPPLAYNGVVGNASAVASLDATYATVTGYSTAFSGQVSGFARMAISGSGFFASEAPSTIYDPIAKTFTLSIPYSFNLSLTRDDTSQFCQAFASLTLNVTEILPTYQYNSITLPPAPLNGEWYFHGATADDLTMSYTDSRTATVSLSGVNPDDYLEFSFEVNTTANTMVPQTVVPLPGAVWLLGSGLLGLVGSRKFRKN